VSKNDQNDKKTKNKTYLNTKTKLELN